MHKVHHHHIHTLFYSSVSTHPVEYLFGNVLPILYGPMILGRHIHIVTMLGWVAWRLGETQDGHSGYEFSWSPYRVLPYSVDEGYHVYHHSHNIGNYAGRFHTWDTIFQTNSDYWKFLRERR